MKEEGSTHGYLHCDVVVPIRTVVVRDERGMDGNGPAEPAAVAVAVAKAADAGGERDHVLNL